MPKISNSMPTQTYAVILAAGRTPSSLLSVYGRTCPAMLPVGGKPVIHHSLQYLLSIGIHNVIVGIHSTEERLPRFLEQTFGRQMTIQISQVQADLGPGFTLWQCLKLVPNGFPVLVVLGDTLFSAPSRAWDCQAPWVLTSPVEDSKRWCVVDCDHAGHVLYIHDKQLMETPPHLALIGVYAFPEASIVAEALKITSESGIKKLEIRHAIQPFVENGTLQAFPADEWMDCGNLDLYSQTRRRILQSREFNSISVDELRGTITKRSRHKAKLIDEINYYRVVPSDLAIFFPRLVNFDIKLNEPFLTQEFYAYPTLSELWVFEELDASFWQAVFCKLRAVMDCFSAYQSPAATQDIFHFYQEKTALRLQTFSEQSPLFKRLIQAESLSLNGNLLQGWPMLQAIIATRLQAHCENISPCIIHGDLCFPNILLDPASQSLKLIDPRGSFGGQFMFGDPAYDAAKLLHSIHGGYDFIIHDLFSLEGDSTQWVLDIHFPPSHTQVLEAWQAHLGTRFDENNIHLIEALLFLSMTALHKDAPRRQIAMFLTGIQILNKLASL